MSLVSNVSKYKKQSGSNRLLALEMKWNIICGTFTQFLLVDTTGAVQSLHFTKALFN